MPAGTQTKAEPLRSWARSQARAHSDLDATSFALAVAARVRGALEAGGVVETHEASGNGIDLADPPGGWANPWLVGAAHEQAASSRDRTKRGAWYTPRTVVEGLVAMALVDGNQTPSFTVDPTCGGGAFLLAVLDHLLANGVSPEQALESVGGIDIDPGAVEVAKATVSLWAVMHGCGGVEPKVDLGDFLCTYPKSWPLPNAVVGNPPFASPLKSQAVGDSATLFREERPNQFGPYADTAACHLVRASEILSPGGVVCLVQPVSVLSGRDTEGMRNHFDSAASLNAIWCTRESVFDAGVRVVAPVISIRRSARLTHASEVHLGGDNANSSIRLASGVPPKVIRTLDLATASGSNESGLPPSWSSLAAQAFGVPTVKLALDRRLGDIAEATAGFRDEHYGLAAACVEESDSSSELRLTTVGSIDPLFGWWGHRQTRFAGNMWDRPVIELDMLDPKVGRWVQNQLRPKVVLPTQSRVLEPLIDLVGNLVPATPVLAIHASAEQLHHVAAVLLAPPVVAWALERSFGSAMSLDAVKLSASQVQNLPLPSNIHAWDQAAAVLVNSVPSSAAEGREVALSVARLMMDAYDAQPEVLEWYESRFPPAK